MGENLEPDVNEASAMHSIDAWTLSPGMSPAPCYYPKVCFCGSARCVVVGDSTPADCSIGDEGQHSTSGHQHASLPVPRCSSTSSTASNSPRQSDEQSPFNLSSPSVDKLNIQDDDDSLGPFWLPSPSLQRAKTHLGASLSASFASTVATSQSSSSSSSPSFSAPSPGSFLPPSSSSLFFGEDRCLMVEDNDERGEAKEEEEEDDDDDDDEEEEEARNHLKPINFNRQTSVPRIRDGQLLFGEHVLKLCGCLQLTGEVDSRGHPCKRFICPHCGLGQNRDLRRPPSLPRVLKHVANHKRCQAAFVKRFPCYQLLRHLLALVFGHECRDGASGGLWFDTLLKSAWREAESVRLTMQVVPVAQALVVAGAPVMVQQVVQQLPTAYCSAQASHIAHGGAQYITTPWHQPAPPVTASVPTSRSQLPSTLPVLLDQPGVALQMGAIEVYNGVMEGAELLFRVLQSVLPRAAGAELRWRCQWLLHQGVELRWSPIAAGEGNDQLFVPRTILSDRRQEPQLVQFSARPGPVHALKLWVLRGTHVNDCGHGTEGRGGPNQENNDDFDPSQRHRPVYPPPAAPSFSSAHSAPFYTASNPAYRYAAREEGQPISFPQWALDQLHVEQPPLAMSVAQWAEQARCQPLLDWMHQLELEVQEQRAEPDEWQGVTHEQRGDLPNDDGERDYRDSSSDCEDDDDGESDQHEDHSEDDDDAELSEGADDEAGRCTASPRPSEARQPLVKNCATDAAASSDPHDDVHAPISAGAVDCSSSMCSARSPIASSSSVDASGVDFAMETVHSVLWLERDLDKVHSVLLFRAAQDSSAIIAQLVEQVRSMLIAEEMHGDVLQSMVGRLNQQYEALIKRSEAVLRTITAQMEKVTQNQHTMIEGVWSALGIKRFTPMRQQIEVGKATLKQLNQVIVSLKRSTTTNAIDKVQPNSKALLRELLDLLGHISLICAVSTLVQVSATLRATQAMVQANRLFVQAASKRLEVIQQYLQAIDAELNGPLLLPCLQWGVDGDSIETLGRVEVFNKTCRLQTELDELCRELQELGMDVGVRLAVLKTRCSLHTGEVVRAACNLVGSLISALLNPVAGAWSVLPVVTSVATVTLGSLGVRATDSSSTGVPAQVYQPAGEQTMAKALSSSVEAELLRGDTQGELIVSHVRRAASISVVQQLANADCDATGNVRTESHCTLLRESIAEQSELCSGTGSQSVYGEAHVPANAPISFTNSPVTVQKVWLWNNATVRRSIASFDAANSEQPIMDEAPTNPQYAGSAELRGAASNLATYNTSLAVRRAASTIASYTTSLALRAVAGGQVDGCDAADMGMRTLYQSHIMDAVKTTEQTIQRRAVLGVEQGAQEQGRVALKVKAAAATVGAGIVAANVVRYLVRNSLARTRAKVGTRLAERRRREVHEDRRWTGDETPPDQPPGSSEPVTAQSSEESNTASSASKESLASALVPTIKHVALATEAVTSAVNLPFNGCAAGHN